MLTSEELAARIGVSLDMLRAWRVRRNAGDEIGPKFVKLIGEPGSIGRHPVRYLLAHVEEWERQLAESAA